MCSKVLWSSQMMCKSVQTWKKSKQKPVSVACMQNAQTHHAVLPSAGIWTSNCCCLHSSVCVCCLQTSSHAHTGMPSVLLCVCVCLAFCIQQLTNNFPYMWVQLFVYSTSRCFCVSESSITRHALGDSVGQTTDISRPKLLWNRAFPYSHTWRQMERTYKQATNRRTECHPVLIRQNAN